MIRDVSEYLAVFDEPRSSERRHELNHVDLSLEAWMELVEHHPRCHLALTAGRHVPLQVLDRLSDSRDFAVRHRARSRAADRRGEPVDRGLDPHELVEYDLSDLERDVLAEGLWQWGGPAHCTEEMAIAMGFASVEHLWREGSTIAQALHDREPMSHRDWARSLLSTEIVFASYVMGAAWDWRIVTSHSDEVTLETLRAIQERLVVDSAVRSSLGTRPT